MQPPILVGVAGGSGSGKTTVARALAASFRAEQVQIVLMDSYYRDRRDVPFEERARINYDHPDAFDEPLLVEQLRALRAGRGVDQPVYDFTRHERDAERVRVEPSRVVLVEGILVLALPAVRELLHLKLFVDTPGDLRFLRRLRRDVAERGRTIDSVIEQYLTTVRPMHEAFIEPSRRHADLIIPEGGHNEIAVDLIRAWMDRLVQS
ncbi:MAG: uridine kinase [Planctomycetes bacterium]|nr:uridine kinase [Planctomycetota bacterium]